MNYNIHQFFFPQHRINKYEKYGDPENITTRLTGKRNKPMIIINPILQNGPQYFIS